jgi:hypothetical protein
MAFIEQPDPPVPATTPGPTYDYGSIPVIEGAPTGVPLTEDGFARVAFDVTNQQALGVCRGFVAQRPFVRVLDRTVAARYFAPSIREARSPWC